MAASSRTHMVTAVTVRGTHRRQGLLRRMMTEDLAAAEAGRPAWPLTESEGSIYGRFGYGVATFERSVKVDRAPVRSPSPGPSGTGGDRGPQGAARTSPRRSSNASHRHTPGSIVRQDAYRQNVSGTVGRDGKEDEAIKCALHYDADGDGGRIRFLQICRLGHQALHGGDRGPRGRNGRGVPGALAIPRQHRPRPADQLGRMRRWTIRWSGRWRTLAASKLPTTGTCSGSGSWTASAALGARRYSADGTLVLGIEDALGFAGGTFRLTSKTARPASRRRLRTRGPDLSMDVADLASIYLGAVCPVTLKAAGRILEHKPGAALRRS